uniref:Uncharacterized protein n=1 Tax=Brassica oleracea TaxID=3712 RepID=A0A3P6EDZ0_BRAOL|nr:unnamed protein product [Brassica oleracea]
MATEVESPGRLCTVSLSKKKPPSYLGKYAHNNRYHSSKDYTCLCCPCESHRQVQYFFIRVLHTSHDTHP